MKKIILATLISVFAVTSYAEAEKKEVCKDVIGKDGQVVKDKAGKPKQTCKIIKVHKKLEGTPVPEKDKKK
jgi:hypothetical protein